ncbi:MAG: low specificity L-threonine aldolase [Lachnospiraceae bacterium]|nr:low specificity L-threonine aldolase [Lachnospiraceae bacterium]
MISFESDYIAGAHPKVLQRLLETNMEPLSGYGNDIYCASAQKKIRAACACPTAEVYFLAGGTQTNAVVISSMLQSYEGAIAAKTGHVSTHEAGAIEHTGHKVLALAQKDGKIVPAVLRQYLKTFYADENRDHMVFPGMVYISHPTEYGTLYSKNELTEISQICAEYEIPLFLDGARLGYGLMSRQTDVTLADIAALCDVFYIGGTKVGALCGEAVVFTKNNTPKHFMTTIKQNGALLAKGRVLGIQFDALFTDNLYFKISQHAVEMAEKLKSIFKEKGYHFYLESPTNQQFIILENREMEYLKTQVAFSFWEKLDDMHTVVRFATSWSTTEEDLEHLKEILSLC